MSRAPKLRFLRDCLSFIGDLDGSQPRYIERTRSPEKQLERKIAVLLLEKEIDKKEESCSFFHKGWKSCRLFQFLRIVRRFFEFR